MTTDPARFIGVGILTLVGAGGCFIVAVQALVDGTIRVGRHSDQYSAAVDGGMFWWVVLMHFIVGAIFSILAISCFYKVFGGKDSGSPPPI
jgi:RsiW-degrading membrane proteinase PrsW (M82 family)